MRLRTLPLSTGGVLLGILLAVADWKVDPWTAVLIVLTTICLQILSNLSNELGDVLRGTDTAEVAYVIFVWLRSCCQIVFYPAITVWCRDTFYFWACLTTCARCVAIAKAPVLIAGDFASNVVLEGVLISFRYLLCLKGINLFLAHHVKVV